MTSINHRVIDLIAREKEARAQMATAVAWGVVRRDALWALKEELGTWKKVADATGQTVPAIQKAAYKRPAERNTP